MATTGEWAPAQVKQDKPPKRWPRRLAKGVGIFVAVLVVLYFVVTSSFFLKSVVVPRVGSALNAQLGVESISLRPFSSVRIRKLNLQPVPGATPLLTVEEVSASYSLWDIIHKRFNIDAVSIVSPVIEIVEQPDGSSNLDPLLKRGEAKAEPESKPTQAPPQVHLNRFQLQNATVRRTKILADGAQERVELNGLNISLSNLRNGHSAALSIAANLGYGDLLKAELSSDIDCGLTTELKPERIQGKIALRTTAADKQFAPLAGVAAEVNCQLSPTDLEEFSVTLARTGKTLARLSAAGPLELARRQGRIKLSLTGIDRELLNLLGAASGIDFTGTSISSEHVIELGESVQTITAQGNVKVNQLTLTRNSASNKPVDLLLEYHGGLNRADHSAVIERFSISGTDSFLRGGLQQPVRISFAEGAASASDSQFSMGVTNFNLADWRNLLGDTTGTLNLALDARAEQSGKRVTLDLRSSLTNLATQVGSNRFDRLNLAFDVKGEMRDFAAIDVSAYELKLTHDAAEACSLSGSVAYNLKARAADLKAEAAAALPVLTRLAGIPDVNVASGTMKFKTRVLQDPARTSVQGDLQLLQLQASQGSLVLKDFESALTWDAALETNLLRVSKFECAFRQSGVSGGSLGLTGQYSLSNQTAAATLILTDLNEHLFRPFIPPDQAKLFKTIKIGGTATVGFDPRNESSLRADLRVSSLPINLDLKADTTLQKTQAIVREFSVAFRANEKPAGHFGFRGSYDLTNQSVQGQVTIKDLTESVMVPFLPDNHGLTSALINADLAAAYDPKGQSGVKGFLALSNLVMRTAKPLSVGLNVDGSLSNQLLNLQTFKVKLDPTERAKNELSLWGQANLAKPDAIQGAMELSAESLDLSAYQKAFAQGAGTNTQQVSTNPPPVARGDARPPATQPSPTEPAAMKLPFAGFSFNAAIDRLFLQDLAIQECLMKLRLNQGRIQLEPLKFAVNGAPASLQSDLNVGVPGYQYDVTLLADKLPLEPIINVLQPDAQGKLKGVLIANAKLRGAGITPPSLRSNLSGAVEFQLTQAHIRTTGPLLRTVLTPIALYLRAPELTDTPLNSAALSAQIGAGRVQMKKLNLTSDSYILDTQGDLLLQDVIPNSPIQRWPLHLQLSRALAQRLKMVPRNAPADAAYVKAPDFLRLAGTLGAPKAEINPAGLAGTVRDKLIEKVLPQQPQTPKLIP